MTTSAIRQKRLQPCCLLFILSWFLLPGSTLHAQCATRISSFPYFQDFEANNGGWTPGGYRSDWAWGTPAKAVINSAASGTKCWIVGGLTGNKYNDNEASWLQSPCFDFSTNDFPYVEFRIFWESERGFDGANFQYSVNNGATWVTVGNINSPINCFNQNWYNTTARYLSPLSSSTAAWAGSVRSVGSCVNGGGSNGWVTAKRTLPELAGESMVLFRFGFGAGSTCNNYEGFAVDDIFVGVAPPNNANFTYSCTSSNTVSFTNTSDYCPSGFSWNFGDPASGGSNTSSDQHPTHTFSGPGTYSVTLTVTGPDNAPSTVSKPITIIAASASVVNPVNCFNGSDGSVTVTPAGSAGPFTYSWNTTPAQSTATATGLGAGTYTVTVSTANSCPAQAQVTLTQPPAFGHTITSQTNPSCNSSNGSISIEVTGGTPGYTYSWSPIGGTDATADNLPAGNYVLTVTDSRNCQYQIPVSLSNLNAPVVSIQSYRDISCFGLSDGNIMSSVSGGVSPYTYSWSPTGGNDAAASNLPAGNYELTVTDAEGCIGTASQTLTEPPQLITSITVRDATCGLANGSITSTATGGVPPYTYNWSPATISGPSPGSLAPGTYSLSITDQHGCTTAYPGITIVNNGSPVSVYLGADTTICFGESLLLAPGSFSSYTWQDNSIAPVFTVTTPGQYWVRVTNADGCEKADTINVSIDPVCSGVFFPSAFTPNGDGLNDEFGPVGNLSGLSQYSFSVYNRWGERVFYSTNPFYKWNGKVKGLQPGSNVFVWQASFSLEGKPRELRKGTVLLIR